MSLNELLKQIFPYEKALSQMTSKNGGRAAKVDALKNILYNGLPAIHAAAEELDAKSARIRELEEMNAALNTALGDADKAGRKGKGAAQDAQPPKGAPLSPPPDGTKG